MGENQTRDSLPNWFTVAEASRMLGITQTAVRKRIEREKIPHRKDPAGPALVYVTQDDIPRDTFSDRSRDELVEELRDRLRYVEHQLEQEQRANEQNRRLLAAALERIPPQLEAPSSSSEPSESPVTDTEGEGRGAQQEQQQPRSWWREFFGFGE